MITPYVLVNPGTTFVLVLGKASHKVVGHADVEDPATSISEDVDVEVLGHINARFPGAAQHGAKRSGALQTPGPL